MTVVLRGRSHTVEFILNKTIIINARFVLLTNLCITFIVKISPHCEFLYLLHCCWTRLHLKGFGKSKGSPINMIKKYDLKAAWTKRFHLVISFSRMIQSSISVRVKGLQTFQLKSEVYIRSLCLFVCLFFFNTRIQTKGHLTECKVCCLYISNLVLISESAE